MVLNRVDYDNKIQSLLDDTATYEKLSRDPTNKFKEIIIKTLKELEQNGVLERKLYLKLYPTSENPPTFYGLPKIHKAAVPLRPIVSSIDSITYEIAKHLTSIIGPLAGTTVHHVKNSGDFVKKIEHLKVNTDETIVSYDVTALFTCIPPDDALAVVKEKLEQDLTLKNRTPLSPSQVAALLEVCLKTTYFLCKGSYYKQNHGCAMGSPVSPIVVNLYMEKFESVALATYKGTPPSHWYRYVDDTWVLLKKSELEEFSEHINSVDNNIKFTRESLENDQLPFLDCLVRVQPDGTLRTSVYRKATHTDQYLLFNSHHPLNQKFGVIRTLHHRAKTIPSTQEDKQKEEKHLKRALHRCGYKNWTFQTALKQKTSTRVDRNNRPSRRPVNIVLPYIGNLSETVQRICRSYNIITSFKPAETLRQHLVHPKDKVDKNQKSNVIYHIKCSDSSCRDSYIGETSQPLKKRLQQHRRLNTSGQQSAVFQHMSDTGHNFCETDVKVLDREKRWFERGVKEAIFERKHRPSLNRRGGLRHLLSHTWDNITNCNNNNNTTFTVFSLEGGNSSVA